MSERGTNYIDDPYWRNMVLYASNWNAIPVFAGVSPKKKNGQNHVYLVDLRERIELNAGMMSARKWKTPDEQQVKRLLREAWDTVTRCNMVLGETTVECPTCHGEVIIPAMGDDKQHPRYLEAKIKAINNINKLLWRSGAEATQDDLTSIFERAEEVANEETEKSER